MTLSNGAFLHYFELEVETILGKHVSETKNTKSQIRLPIILALAISAGIWIGATFAEPKGNQNDLRAALYKLQEIMTYINRDYVDSVDTNELVEYGINKMLENLDPHSSYIPARDASLAQSQLDGEFDGIGVEFGIIRGADYSEGACWQGDMVTRGYEPKGAP